MSFLNICLFQFLTLTTISSLVYMPNMLKWTTWQELAAVNRKGQWSLVETNTKFVYSKLSTMKNIVLLKSLSWYYHTICLQLNNTHLQQYQRDCIWLFENKCLRIEHFGMPLKLYSLLDRIIILLLIRPFHSNILYIGGQKETTKMA